MKESFTVNEHELVQIADRDFLLQANPDQIADYFSQFVNKDDLERVLHEVCSDPDLLAKIAYWEKWLKKDQFELLESIRDKQRERHANTPDTLPLGIEKRFTEKELQLIFENISAIQLTYGCSAGCPHCGFDAIKGVREHIPYPELETLYKKYGHLMGKSKAFLYWASEPSDYRSEDSKGQKKVYADVHELAVKYAGYHPQVTTIRREEEWLDQLKEFASGRPRISTQGLGKEDLAELKEKADLREIKMTTADGLRHFSGMGISEKKQRDIDPEILKSGIACKDGILLTPRGLYSIVVTPISKKFPQGTIIVPLEGVSDRTIEPGENMEDVLRRSVAETKYSHKGAPWYGDKKSYQEYYGGKIKTIKIHTSDSLYVCTFDSLDGNILNSVKIIDEDPFKILQDRWDDFNRVPETQEGIDKAIKEVCSMILSTEIAYGPYKGISFSWFAEEIANLQNGGSAAEFFNKVSKNLYIREGFDGGDEQWQKWATCLNNLCALLKILIRERNLFKNVEGIPQN